MTANQRVRTAGAVASALVMVGIVAAGLAAQTSAKPGGQAAAVDPWVARTTRVPFQAQKAPDVALQIDVPRKDWQALPAGGGLVLGLLARKGDAAVLVERSTLRQALAADDITDVFAQIEADAVKERHPTATDLQAKVIDVDGRRLIAVQYGRVGVLGAERVRQYSMPVGSQLYRLTCVSVAAQFGAYEAIFSHMAASVVIGTQQP